MIELLHLYFVLCFLQILSTLSFNSSAPTQLCPRHQSLALTQFKNSLSIDCSASKYSCLEYRKKTIQWKEGTSCCLWDGVKCESKTGNVIGLDLSCSCLRGIIPSNSTLFHLHHLQHLNLAYNGFGSSQLSLRFGQFSNLTHLNISDSGFTGIIPLQISHLSKLLSLDLSDNFGLTFEGHVFEKVLGNLTQLQHLLLDEVDMSSVVPASFLNMSSYIMTLSLDSNELQGRFPVDVFRFPYLRDFMLLDNDVEINFPMSNWSSPLRSLIVSTPPRPYVDSFMMLGELPDSIGNLRSLEVLDVSSSNLEGSIPASLVNLTRLNFLDLHHNLIHGPILFSFSNFKQLNSLDLSDNNLAGQISDSFENLTELIDFSLGNNQFSGPLPLSAFNLAQIESLDFSENKLEGPLPTHVSGLSRLRGLHLNSNFFSGKIPSWLFSLPSLVQLGLSDNKLAGSIKQFDSVGPLEGVYLGNNEINGPISSFSKFVNLSYLDLSSTKLNGIFDLSKFSKLRFLSLSNTAVVLSLSTRNNGNYSFPNLHFLYLSSCKLTEFPDIVRNLQGLSELDLSYNRIRMIEADMF
ncbi:hypothetical protein PTKIN_Ptkin14bG0173200 [Pterospermum kingtungense]